jgi:hypothetical protein
MSKLLFLTMIMTLQALSSEPDRRNFFASHTLDHQEEAQRTQQPKITPQEQLMRMHEEYKKNISDVRQELEQQKKEIQALKDQLKQNYTVCPPYKKIIPADKILAISVFLATLSGYQTYMYSGSIILAFGTFCSHLYSIYACFKLARDTATIASTAPLLNKIG